MLSSQTLSEVKNYTNQTRKEFIETPYKRGKRFYPSAQSSRREVIGIANKQFSIEKENTDKEVRLKRGEAIPTTTTSAVVNNNNNHPQKQLQQQDPSCYRSPILQNVTLRGGIQAGYFRKLAEHVAMKLCVELCCEEKGCDVAFMWGKHCYGVQCFSRDLCEAVPAKRDVTESIMLSHVTFQGERSK